MWSSEAVEELERQEKFLESFLTDHLNLDEHEKAVDVLSEELVYRRAVLEGQLIIVKALRELFRRSWTEEKKSG